MANRFTKAAQEAADLTNRQLEGKLNTLLTANAAQIQKLRAGLSTEQDRQNFDALIAHVNAEASQDRKLALLRSNLQTTGSVALKALSLLT